MLRALSLCTCCRQYPGAATGRRLRSSRPAVSAFPEVAVGSACTSTFSELARRSLELRPAHSRRHLYVTSYTEGFSHFVASMTAPVARHVLATVLSLPPRRSEGAASIRFRLPMLPSPSGWGLGLRGYAFSRPLLRSLSLRPGNSSSSRRETLSIGFRVLVSRHPAIQTTGP